MSRIIVRVSEETLEKIQRLIEEGHYYTISEFVREAIREKLKKYKFKEA